MESTELLHYRLNDTLNFLYEQVELFIQDRTETKLDLISLQIDKIIIEMETSAQFCPIQGENKKDRIFSLQSLDVRDLKETINFCTNELLNIIEIMEE